MELSLPHMLHLFNIFREYDGKDNCAQVLEEEIYKMFGTIYLNDEHDCNVLSMNSLTIHDANDIQSHKLGEAMFDEDDIFFCPPSFDEQIYYDESMTPIYDDYCDDTYAIKNKDNHETCHHDFNLNWIMLHMIVILLSLVPLLFMKRSLLMWRVVKFICLCIMKIMLYVIVILLNSLMKLLKIIIRYEYMLVGIAIISSFLSMCLKS